MSSRRKEMWKLLYSLLNREENDLNELLVCVDDILCKEPSLICQSAYDGINQFQDTFVLWIFNKLFINLNLHKDNRELQERNLSVQCKLLNSALINRSLLFMKLLEAYSLAVDQLIEGYMRFTNFSKVMADNICIEISAFHSSDTSLMEIDKNFSFAVSKVHPDDVDDCLRYLLDILQHCVIVAYNYYSDIFDRSLLAVFKVFRECYINTKLKCLQYVSLIFKRNVVLKTDMEKLYEMCTRAVTNMWQQIPLWLTHDNLNQMLLDEVIAVSCELLGTLGKFLQQPIPYIGTIVQHCFTLMRNILDVFYWQRSQLIYDLSNLQMLSASLVDFMFPLLLNYSQSYDLGGEKTLDNFANFTNFTNFDLLKNLSEIYPFVMRLIPVFMLLVEMDSAGHSSSSSSCVLADYHHFGDYVQQKIEKFFENDTPMKKDYDLIKEILASICLLEHLHLRKQQLTQLTDKYPLNCNEIEMIQQPVEIFSSKQIEKLNSKLPNYLQKFMNCFNTASSSCQMNSKEPLMVIGFLLKSMNLRKLLQTNIYCKLLKFLLQPLLRLPQTAIDDDRSRILEAVFDLVKQLNFPKSMNEVLIVLRTTFINISRQLFNYEIIVPKCLKSKLARNLINFSAFGYITQRHLSQLNDLLFTNLEFIPVYFQIHCCIFSQSSSDYTVVELLSSVMNISSKEPQQWLHLQVLCSKCSKTVANRKYLEQNIAVIRQEKYAEVNLNGGHMELSDELKDVFLKQLLINSDLAFTINHLECFKIDGKEYIQVIGNSIDLTRISLTVLNALTKRFSSNIDFTQGLLLILLRHTINTLRATAKEEEQLHVLKVLNACTENGHLNTNILYHYFKMTFFFIGHPESLVIQDAIQCANDMCEPYNLKPMQLWNWYKRDALSLIVKMVLQNYLTTGRRITTLLKRFTYMLGFSCAQEFICKYHRLLITTILPFCVKQPFCKGFLLTISKVTRKPLPNLFTSAFLRIYTHVYMTEEVDVADACMEIVRKTTGVSLSNLMNADVKQTVLEFLFYFNRNPQFVMKAFQYVLPNNCAGDGGGEPANSKSPINAFANFIADRFLGVITHFQNCLAEPTFEVALKQESLRSLGQILRLIGSHHVTQFRFKIIAMLSFVLTLNDPKLQDICLQIWSIFLHIVNIQELGPMLSRIVIALQPLLATNCQEVNALYDFLILQNDNLLGTYLPDLYFLADVNGVKPAIRQFVARQNKFLKGEHSGLLLDKVQFFYKQIISESMQVRIYGLQHLRSFIAANRSEINRLILNVIRADSIIEDIVDALVAGCHHEDRNLQLASAKCLGELGAIDPSYMPSNDTFVYNDSIPLNIHTDDFAIMALTELCRAYQFQKETKYVDNFSLAIQETLAVFGVSPKDKKKMDIWLAIPERMRQVMEPLLTSCYTNAKHDTVNAYGEQPLFNSRLCRCFEDWAFIWASRLIELVQSNETTRHLLNSYKPSIKRDNKILALFFPYILLHALKESNSDDINRIFEEFCAVFQYSKTNVEKKSLITTPTMSTRGGHEEFTVNELMTQTCVKHCSEQLDFLQFWVREWQRLNTAAIEKSVQQTDDGSGYVTVAAFLRRFDYGDIAKANFECSEYARALLYLEDYIAEDVKSNRIQEQLSFLIQIHGKLMDSDSVEGAVSLKKTPVNLAEEIMINKIVDRPQETITCYEQLLSTDVSFSQENIKGFIDCYLHLDTPETALLLAEGFWHKLSTTYPDDYLIECKADIFWRLGRFDDLEDLLNDPMFRPKNNTWSIQCAEAFLLFRDNCHSIDNFLLELDNIRSNVLCNLHSCSRINQNSYPHCYQEAIRLHLLDEVEKCKLLINDIKSKSCNTIQQLNVEVGKNETDVFQRVEEFFNYWNDRINILRPTARIMETVYCFRRNLLLQALNLLQMIDTNKKTTIPRICERIKNEIGNLWLGSVQMYRESGYLQQAQLSLMKAEQYAPAVLFLEKAKLMWQKGDQTYTFKLLEDNIQRIDSLANGNISQMDATQRNLYTEAKLLQATYNAESLNICSELNLRFFNEALSANNTSEKCYVQLAQYMEKIYESFSSDEKKLEMGCRMLFDIMNTYASSLKYGFENVYQSLPRLLSLWLDFTSEVASTPASVDSRLSIQQEIAQKTNVLINYYNDVLPTAIFYTAFSQLLSRICHPSNDVCSTLRNIVVKLIEHFPQQSLWMLLPILKSYHSMRVKRCRLIFMDKRLNKADFQKLLNDFNMLAERLIELTNKELIAGNTYALSSLVKELPGLFQQSSFSKIMLPFEKYMQASFPFTANTVQSINSNSTKQQLMSGHGSSDVLSKTIFPHGAIYIRGVMEKIVVLRSAAKPKKICIQCSDGCTYTIMVKPKDDLRKDFRLMEFNGLVKRYLHQDSQARHRRLRIRTYAAIPFNEECGLVEWLPKLKSFRSICMEIYKAKGLGIPDRILLQNALPKTDPIQKKLTTFQNVLLPRYPPVFHEWFRRQFPTPHSWYLARNSYIKTIAVMSMVGYILGLGDRHGENILFDETNGDAVHVDFNCLFNLGETFAYPEIVPFRLTHNMVFAMGPLGIEGLFRKCCEITLRVLKHESKTLMSVLRPFVYDLGSVYRNQMKPSTSLEITNPKAMLDVKRISERFQGYVKKTMKNCIPLSTEGQVNFLIKEATDIANLAAMYIGWGAYI